jgi:hypothetical protein
MYLSPMCKRSTPKFLKYSMLVAVLWIRNDYFGSVPDPDPTFQLVLDPDLDPVSDPTRISE